jgi:hypothetical protein
MDPRIRIRTRISRIRNTDKKPCRIHGCSLYFQADYQTDTGAVKPAGRPHKRSPQHIPHLTLQAQPAAVDGLVIGSEHMLNMELDLQSLFGLLSTAAHIN